MMKKIAVFMLMLLCVSCQPVPPTSLKFSLLWQGQPLHCQQILLLGQQAWQLQQLQLYVSNFSLDKQPLTLLPSAYRSEEVALLGTDCRGDGQFELIFQQQLHHGRLAFELGLPVHLNHQNPLTAQVPLQQAEMHWSWQGGYKFLRLEMSQAGQDWSLHLGSTGCQSPSAMRAPDTPCQAPNRVAIELDYRGQTGLSFDIAPLFASFTPHASQSCMSDPLQLSCQQLLPILTATPNTLWSLQP